VQYARPARFSQSGFLSFRGASAWRLILRHVRYRTRFLSSSGVFHWPWAVGAEFRPATVQDDRGSSRRLSHWVCTQFGEHVGYDQVASGVIGYNSDDARNVITAAVLTLCPQYESLVGG